MKKNISVAIAILNQHGKTLIAWRDEHLHQGGRYEFAGGKVEIGETPEQACRREVLEEVGIDIEHWQKVDEIVHDYGDKIVHLHFFKSHVTVEQNSYIKPAWQWVYRDELAQFTFPAANQTVIDDLIWQNQIKIHHQLVSRIEAHQLFYWRYEGDMQRAVQQLIDYPQALLARLMINIELYQHCPSHIQNAIYAIHLKEWQLLDNIAIPANKRVIASCHSMQSIQLAEQKGCEAIFCSPIQATTTHPTVKPLGWQTLQQWAKQTSCLVFALGGLEPSDLTQARACGAFGVAGIRNF